MKIYGIGTDIVNIKRIDKSLKKHGAVFKKKYFLKKKLVIVKEKKILVHTLLKGTQQKKRLVRH